MLAHAGLSPPSALDSVLALCPCRWLKLASAVGGSGSLSVASLSRYCISNSLATLFGIRLTEAHIPLQDYETSNSVTPKMVVLDAGRYQVSLPGLCLSSGLRDLGDRLLPFQRLVQVCSRVLRKPRGRLVCTNSLDVHFPGSLGCG